MHIKRCLERKINDLVEMFPCVAILGPRQCGKSTLAQSLDGDWSYYDLESPDDYQLITSDPVRFFELNPNKVIINEAQQYPDLFRTLRSVIDRDRSKNGRFFLTGSSSPEIVKGLNESLAGRIATTEMTPLKSCEFYQKNPTSFLDVVLSKNVSAKDFLSLKTSLENREVLDFWFKGGFPEPLLKSQQNPRFYKVWMDNYISSYVERDIRALFPKLNIQNFKRFLLLLA